MKSFIGYNSIGNLKQILDENNPKSIFLVTGKTSYDKSGAKAILNNILKNCNVVHFTDFEVNPKLEDIEKGITLFKKNNCDFVIAVGGGSVMDVAKSINVFAVNQGTPLEIIKKEKNIENKGKLLVALPTTSGSGSEATRYAVVYLGKTKYSITHEILIPDYSIVDAQFTESLPRYITAYTGMDAFSQAIESYWSINSTQDSKQYAKEAIKLLLEHLPKAANNPNKESREKVAEAAFLAGKAINISRTTACHSISYPITSYFKVPHGHAVALTLAAMLKFNSEVTEEDALDERGVDYVRSTIKEIIQVLGCKGVEVASGKIKKLMQDIGLETNLSNLGINEEDKEVIIKNGFNPDRVKNNPRKLTEETLRKILHSIK